MPFSEKNVEVTQKTAPGCKRGNYEQKILNYNSWYDCFWKKLLLFAITPLLS